MITTSAGLENRAFSYQSTLRPTRAAARNRGVSLKAVAFHGDYWGDGYCHLKRRLCPLHLQIVQQELADKVALKPGYDPEKIHHRNAKLEQHIDSVRALLDSDWILEAAQELLGEQATLVRSTLIDKPIGSSWHVDWHQDRTPFKYSGHSGRQVLSQSENQRIADQLVAVRIHLDHSGMENGGLMLIPGSHRNGLYCPDELKKCQSSPSLTLEQPLGTVMFMHPFIVHSSKPNLSGESRRVLHCEFIKQSAL